MSILTVVVIPGNASRPLAEPAPVGISEVAYILHVKRQTVDQWIVRGVLPTEAGRISGNPWWWKHDIERWAKQTGRL